jgi:short-subunit dehydrogenase
MKPLQKIKNGFNQIRQITDKPESIARGFALGSFIGMMPIPGFQMMVALIFSSVLKINRKSACFAVFNTNLATGLFVFAFNFWMGKRILGLNPEFTMPDKLSFGFINTVIDSGFDVFISLTLGGCISGIVAAGISYLIVKRILKKNTMKKISLKNEPIQIKHYTVITGASSGLGKAMANECAKMNLNLILIALPNENLKNFGAEIHNKYKIDVKCREVDLTNPFQLEQTADWINTNFKIKALINNAGIGGSNSFQNVTAKYVDDILFLNIRALVQLTHKLLFNLKSNAKSYILNIASMASFGPMPYKTVYPASKAFVYSFSRGLWAELKHEGVYVCVAHPGGMATNKDVSQRINNHNRLIKATILSPEKTAEICVRQLFKGDSLIIPGFMNKMSWLFFKLCPIWLQLIIFRKSIKKELKIEKTYHHAA